MTRGAPEMSPNLDDAIRALDRVLRNTSTGSGADLVLACRFLDLLDEVRNVPAVVLEEDQAATLEGAYQAGFRTADEPGHVLVVSLPDLLAYAGHVAPVAPRWTAARALERLGALFSRSRGALVLLVFGWVCFVFQAFGAAGGAFALALFVALHAQALERAQQWQNRARLAESALETLTKSHAGWKRRAQSAEGRISTAQIERLFAVGGRHAG